MLQLHLVSYVFELNPLWGAVPPGVPAGPQQALAALTAGCCDSVLAVRIPAAASLASFCQMLSQAAAAPAAEAGAAVAAAMLPACLQLAVAATGDGDKLRPGSLQAIGSLFALREALPAGQRGVVSERLLGTAAEAVQLCLGSGSARVQWAACEAAGQLLACAPPPAQPHWAPLLLHLSALLRQCPNFRSRGLAAAALRRVGDGGPPPMRSAAALLETAAGVLFEGEARCRLVYSNCLQIRPLLLSDWWGCGRACWECHNWWHIAPPCNC